MPAPDLSAIAATAHAQLDAAFAAREVGIADSRKAIRASAKAIRSLHRGESDKASELMAEAKELLRKAQTELADHPDLFYAGFVGDAAKEYAEARLTAALSTGTPLPSPSDLGVEVVPYLHGLGEAVGELRRRLLDLLRAGDLPAAEVSLAVMDDVVDLLADLDYPDGMTNGLRRVTDVARSLAERSRSDLTATAVQERLRRELAERLDS